MGEWQPISTAPKDGTAILATLRVYTGRIFSHWDTHIVWTDDETGEIHNDAYQGWDWDSYEWWQPLPSPPEPADG